VKGKDFAIAPDIGRYGEQLIPYTTQKLKEHLNSKLSIVFRKKVYNRK